MNSHVRTISELENYIRLNLNNVSACQDGCKIKEEILNNVEIRHLSHLRMTNNLTGDIILQCNVYDESQFQHTLERMNVNIFIRTVEHTQHNKIIVSATFVLLMVEWAGFQKDMEMKRKEFEPEMAIAKLKKVPSRFRYVPSR